VEYVFVLRGRLGRALEAALSPVAVLERSNSTEMRLEIEDDAQLYGAIAKMERLGLSIESLEPASGPSPREV
jgi:hypothetical protein